MFGWGTGCEVVKDCCWIFIEVWYWWCVIVGWVEEPLTWDGISSKSSKSLSPPFTLTGYWYWIGC